MNKTELELTRSQTETLMFTLMKILFDKDMNLEFDKDMNLDDTARTNLNSIYGKLVSELELTKD